MFGNCSNRTRKNPILLYFTLCLYRLLTAVRRSTPRASSNENRFQLEWLSTHLTLAALSWKMWDYVLKFLFDAISQNIEAPPLSVLTVIFQIDLG